MRRPRRLKNEINVVPYIDVMLVLLVIFMVATPMMQSGSVDVPSTGQGANPVPANPLKVLVKADGTLAVQSPTIKERSVSRAELVEVLRAEHDKNPDIPVLVAGDAKVNYEAVFGALDEVRGQGIKKVGLETTNK